MRDDVKVFFTELITNLELKSSELYSLLEKEKLISYLINNRNDSEKKILNIIDLETELIDKINLIEFKISQLKDEIGRRYHIDFNMFFRENFKLTELEFIKYKDEILTQKKILHEIHILKEKNNKQMMVFQEDLKVQIYELERMSKLELIKPKDLRFS